MWRGQGVHWTTSHLDKKRQSILSIFCKQLHLFSLKSAIAKEWTTSLRLCSRIWKTLNLLLTFLSLWLCTRTWLHCSGTKFLSFISETSSSMRLSRSSCLNFTPTSRRSNLIWVHWPDIGWWLCSAGTYHIRSFLPCLTTSSWKGGQQSFDWH